MAKQHDICFYDIEVFKNFFLLIAKTLKDDKFHYFRIFHVGGGAFVANEVEELIQFFSVKGRFFVGFNNRHFDDQLVALIFKNRELYLEKGAKYAATQLKKATSSIITYGNWTRLPVSFRSIDLLSITQVNDRRISLKKAAINMKWPLILDLPLPVEATVQLADGPSMLRYCKNDVNITEHLYKALREDINMRAKMSVKYGVNLLSDSNSTMSSRILEPAYSKITKQNVWSFRNDRTPREWMSMSDIVGEEIEFKTPGLQRFLIDIKGDHINTTQSWGRKVRINDTYYDVAKGGLHSVHYVVVGKKKKPKPVVYQSKKGYDIIDADVSSYYPNIMLNLQIRPAHLEPSFLDLVGDMTDERLAAKKKGDVVTSESNKVTVNSVFGKFNYEHSWLYDPMALYRITINGQLFLLMLIEALEMKGITVLYANTDGIVAKVYKDQRDLFYTMCRGWTRRHKFVLDFSLFETFAIRDVNNYLAIKTDGKVKGKGDLDKDNLIHPTVILGLHKGFDSPIISLALHNYFVYGIQIEDTINDHEDVLDFCKAQGVGKMFSQVFHEKLDIEGRVVVREPVQKINRYFVCKTSHGGILSKYKADGSRVQMVKDHNVFLVNDLKAYKKKMGSLDIIDRRFYIGQANKIVEMFTVTQSSLI